MSNPYFANNRQNPRRSFSNSYSHVRQPSRNSMNFTDNFNDFSSSFQNSAMRAARAQGSSSYSNNLNASISHDLNSTMHSIIGERSFSSLFDNSSSIAAPQNSNNKSSENSISSGSVSGFSRENHDLSGEDDDGVFLQISNLDQWYDESSLKHYLMNQLKPITPILSLTIETPSIAKVKVPSIQFAKQVVSHLHRKKMGHKRIFVSFLKDKTSAECSALRNKVIGLLMDVPTHQLAMSKFRELFQSRFKSSISILDLYRMPDVCSIIVNSNDEKIISLESTATKSEEVDMVLKTEQHSAPYCIFHYKPDKNKGWAEIEIEPLPIVFMTIAQVQSIIHPLLQIHQGDIPVASLLYCLEAEMNVQVSSNDRGVSFEHLVACVPNVTIKNNDYGIKILAWRDESLCEESFSSKNYAKTTLNSSCGDSADNISKEVIELIRMCPKSTMQFSKFIPSYHNHFGKQCRVADYGCTKLIEMFEAMSSVVQVLGEGESRQITLTHRVQIRRFSTDIFKIIRNQQSKSIFLSNLPQLFLATYNRLFDVTDYGVCDIQDLLAGLRNSNFIQVTKIRDDSEDYVLSLQKRRQTNVEIEKTNIFAGEVVELLRNAPQFSIPFRKFVRSYHYYFGYQCKLSDYGFMRLAELLEALSGIVEMDLTNEENRKIFLSRKVALRIFSEQIQEIIKLMTGHGSCMVKYDELLEMHKNKYGYQMHGSSLGYDSVIDALKFVPFVELHSYENEVWLVSHLENEKFRQRALLACLAIVDIGGMVPLSKFHAVFAEKFKFSIQEKQLHAMKHAIQIEMVNGTKMISITPMMKFMMHIVNVLEQRKIMNIQEIKSLLKVNLMTCFNFGFPNILSMFQAFPDIFKITKVTVGFHERCDIELNRTCPLSPSGLQHLIALGKIQLPDDKPEIFKQVQKHPIGYNRNNRPIIAKVNGTNSDKSPYPHYIQLNPFCRNYNNQNNNNNNVNVHPYNMDTTMPKESIGNGFQQNFEEPQGFYERNLKFQQQQQIQAMKRDYWNNSAGYSSTNSSSSYSGYESLNSQPKYSMLSPFNRFETPESPKLSKPTTIWFDPVWKSDGDMFDSNRGSSASGTSNTSESLKAFNVHVVSPFMSFKTMFTFDNINPNGNNSANNNNNSNNPNMKM